MRRAKACSLFVFLALVLITDGSARPEESGTAFVMRGQGAVLLARNLDWPVGEGMVFVNKKDLVKEAFGGSRSDALRWTSKYGSVTFNQFGREFPLGGINEAGLVIEGLSVAAEHPLAAGRSSLNELQWIQYHLDTCRTVKDVLKSVSRLKISKLLFGLHYLVADRKGNAAVIEFNGGQMTSYSGEALPVTVLSDSRYAESIRDLRLRQGFGGDKAVSGGTGSSERFARAAAALREYRMLGQRPLLDHAFVVLKSVAREDTQWSVAYNAPRRLVFFKTKEHRRYKIIPLESLDFSCRGPALMLAVSTELAGNLARSLFPYSPQENRRLLESVFPVIQEKGEIQGGLPRGLVEEMAAYPELCRCRK
jgi:penicillin V acylase-like amidase (Ntn superfamily)